MKLARSSSGRDEREKQFQLKLMDCVHFRPNSHVYPANIFLTVCLPVARGGSYCMLTSDPCMTSDPYVNYDPSMTSDPCMTSSAMLDL